MGVPCPESATIFWSFIESCRLASTATVLLFRATIVTDAILSEDSATSRKARRIAPISSDFWLNSLALQGFLRLVRLHVEATDQTDQTIAS
jgi:hypothetical protein